MDRCALFVDAGYVLADGAMAVHGTRRRESVSWDYPGLLQLLTGLATERSNLPLLRCYWYDATVEGRRSAEHEALADLPGVKLRVVKMRPGHREGVESEIHRDLTTLARNKAVTDAVVVSAEEDLGQVISDVQDMGLRVTLLHVAADGDGTVPRSLRQECDDIAEIGAAHLQPYVELISGAEPPRPDERDGAAVPSPPNVNGNGNGNGNGRGPSAGRAAAYAQQATAISDAGQQSPVPAAVPVAAPAAAASYQVPEAGGAESGVPAAYQQRFGQDQQQVQPRMQAADQQNGHRASTEHVRAPEYGWAPADYDLPGDGGADRRYAPDYRNFPGYGPGSADFDQAPADARAVPVGTAQVSRLPTRGEPAGGSAAGQPAPPQLPAVQPPAAQPSAGQPAVGQPAVGQQAPGQLTPGQPVPPAPAPVAPPPGMAASAVIPGGSAGPMNGHPSGPHPVAPVVPVAPAGMGYSHGRPPGPDDAGTGQQGGPPAGGQPLPSSVPSAVQVAAAPPAPPAAPGGLHGPAALLDTGYQARQPEPVAPAAHSGGQSGASLADAVQSAHEEGLQFGDSVARDAPALWLEAVLARKPRMPSDLEARLLQGSALPIDYLLHDEVRNALRRGFWDAMERARR